MLLLLWFFAQVPRLRAERKNFTPDPRFMHVVNMVQSGQFGWEDYFTPIMNAITSGRQWYLCGAGRGCVWL